MMKFQEMVTYFNLILVKKDAYFFLKCYLLILLQQSSNENLKTSLSPASVVYAVKSDCTVSSYSIVSIMDVHMHAIEP